jgi:hypothetical protein
MTKFVSAIIASAALAAAAGCSAEAVDPAAQESQALASCPNAQGTNAAIAAFAVAYGTEAHHWQILADFEEYRGQYNQLMLRFKTTYPLGACNATTCPMTAEILRYQNALLDQTIVYDGEKVSAYNFASRLTTGFDNMKTYAQNHQYPFPAHTLNLLSMQNGTQCMTDATYGATAPDGTNLPNPDLLTNALRFSDGNGVNPYLFTYINNVPHLRYTANTVTVDPTGGTSGDPSVSTSGDLTVAGCQAFSPDKVHISVLASDGTKTPVVGMGYPCTCATKGISAGGMRNDTAMNANAPNTFFCVAG